MGFSQQRHSTSTHRQCNESRDSIFILPQVFPVKRKLLRSCIALTAAVRSDEQNLISVHVDVGTLTFDR